MHAVRASSIVVGLTVLVAGACVTLRRQTSVAWNAQQKEFVIERCPPVLADATMFLRCQVNMPAERRDSLTVRYPTILESAGIEGHAIAQVAVDSSGRALLRDFLALDATHEIFTAALRNTLSAARWAPARRNGTAVKQRIFVRVDFALTESTTQCRPQTADLRSCIEFKKGTTRWSEVVPNAIGSKK
jgi:hypothetical protein